MTIDQLQSFTFIPVKIQSAKRGLGKSIVSVAKRGYRLAFSQEFTEEMVSNGFQNFRLAYNEITGDLAFVFFNSAEEGSMFLDAKRKDGKLIGFVINSKSLFEAIVSRLGKKEDSETFFLEMSGNMSKRDNVKFFLVNRV